MQVQFPPLAKTENPHLAARKKCRDISTLLNKESMQFHIQTTVIFLFITGHAQKQLKILWQSYCNSSVLFWIISHLSGTCNLYNSLRNWCHFLNDAQVLFKTKQRGLGSQLLKKKEKGQKRALRWRNSQN